MLCVGIKIFLTLQAFCIYIMVSGFVFLCDSSVCEYVCLCAYVCFFCLFFDYLFFLLILFCPIQICLLLF